MVIEWVVGSSLIRDVAVHRLNAGVRSGIRGQLPDCFQSGCLILLHAAVARACPEDERGLEHGQPRPGCTDNFL